jgi:DNA-binding transcriptional LysR family regulator
MHVVAVDGLDQQRRRSRRPLPGITYDDSIAVFRAAEGGQGLALVRWSLVAGDVAAGRLVIASSRAVQSEWSYYFVCRPDYADVEKVVFSGLDATPGANSASPRALRFPETSFRSS